MGDRLSLCATCQGERGKGLEGTVLGFGCGI